MHPYETASDSFIGDDQYHLRRDPVLLKIFRNKSWRFSEWSSCGDRKHYAKKSCIP